MNTPWYMEVVRVSTREKQQDLLTLLHDIGSVTALGTVDGPDYFVVYECPDWRLKVAIRMLFAEVDPGSKPGYRPMQPLQPGSGGAA